MLKVKELSVELNIHPNTIYRLVEAGMPVMRFGKMFRFDLDKVKVWLESDKDKR